MPRISLDPRSTVVHVWLHGASLCGAVGPDNRDGRAADCPDCACLHVEQVQAETMERLAALRHLGYTHP